MHAALLQPFFLHAFVPLPHVSEPSLSSLHLCHVLHAGTLTVLTPPITSFDYLP